MEKDSCGVTGYADPSPYPEITVLEPSRYYAHLLMEDYAGVDSEETAINQYIYHHFVINDTDVADMIKRIAITEMHHLEILADLILALGGNPVMKGSGGRYWNASFVNYESDLCDRLRADLKSEYKAIQDYENHIRLIDDPHVKEILRRIVLDERLHAEFFRKALKKHCRYT